MDLSTENLSNTRKYIKEFLIGKETLKPTNFRNKETDFLRSWEIGLEFHSELGAQLSPEASVGIPRAIFLSSGPLGGENVPNMLTKMGGWKAIQFISIYFGSIKNEHLPHMATSSVIDVHP